MKQFAFGLLLGTGLFQISAAFPDKLYLLVVFLSLIIAIWRHWPSSVVGFFLGWVWSFGFALLSQPAEIERLDHKDTYQARGVIVGLPYSGNGKTRFLFEIHQLDNRQGFSQQGSWRVRVSWRNAEFVSIGQQWQLPLRLKPANSYRNPGSWDYAGWLYRQGIRYTAYVRDKELPVYLDRSDCCLIDRLRSYFRDQLDRQHLSRDVHAVILALTLGDRNAMTSRLKQIFSLTGTSHLMAISGLHIGLLAGLSAWLTNRIWRRIPCLCRRFPAAIAGAVAGLMIGYIYALISGFGIPAQRAFIMLAVTAFAILNRQRLRPSDMYAVAVILVLLHNPMAIVHAGFWLSFIAVAAILLVIKSLQGRAWWIQAVGIQVGISLALYPLLLIFEMPQSLISPVINLLLVPLFGFFIVPLSLFSVALSPMLAESSFVFVVLESALAPVLVFLAELADLPLPELSLGYWSGLRLGLLMVGVVFILSPLGMEFRWLGLLLLLSVHLPMYPSIEQGAYRLTLLDVGQGLSVVIETRRHTLVYDTGAAYRSGFNLADAVVLPYLHSRGVSQIDHLILSHGDNDHAGGAVALSSGMPVKQISSGEPVRVDVAAEPCYAGQRWQWDGVDFEILHPSKNNRLKGNDTSCVLLIRNAAGASLIPGDIEGPAEASLLDKLSSHVPIRVLIAPHHGSQSSSTRDFVRLVQAEYVLYAVGMLNRYGFPREKVVKRWQNAGAKGLRSDLSGALGFYFKANGEKPKPDKYRLGHARYWHFTPHLSD